MDLKRFRVSNYRSIDDSDFVEVDKLTVLIGRNESGKSNLLRALCSLKPDDEKNLPNSQKDFPRHKQNPDDEHSTPFINSVWELEGNEPKELEGICPRIDNSQPISLTKSYDGKHHFELICNQAIMEEATENEIRETKGYLLSSLNEWFRSLTDNGQRTFKEPCQNLDTLLKTMENFEDGHYTLWANSYLKSIENLYSLLKHDGWDISSTCENHIRHLARLATTVKLEETKMQAAQDWLWKKIPTFIYAHDYPKIYGEYNLCKFRERWEARNQNPEIKFEGEDEAKDISFERLCQTAEIEVESIPPYNQDINNDRDDVMGNASRVLTKKVNRLWRNAQLKVILQRNGDWLNIHIKKEGDSTNQGDEPAAIHLNQQSAGFQWFFNFYVTFATQTDFDSIEENKILLLDEPGLHLHAKSQYDLVQHFKINFENQIIYTTHSPFMVPEALGDIRFVSLGEDGTTKVKGDLKGTQHIFFPDEAALGLSLEQSKRITPYILIVEGFIDVYLLRAVSEHFWNQGKEGIRRDIAIKAAHGVPKIRLFATALFSEKKGIMVLIDKEKDALKERDDLISCRIVREENFPTVAKAFEGEEPEEADIEDILGIDIYGDMVRRSHEEFSTYEKSSKENSEKVKYFFDKCHKMIRIDKRYEEVFRQLNLEFDKAAPITTFCKLLPKSKEVEMSEVVEKRFAKLFKLINNIKADEDDEEDKKPKGGEADKGGGAGGEA